MSGFNKDWLALREPVDMRARGKSLVEQLSQHLGGIERPNILDIGCGTGSTWRSLAHRFPADSKWQLLDYDPLLLAEAERRIGDQQDVSFRQFDLNEIDTLPLTEVSVVTASALFDLCSGEFCDHFAKTLAVSKTGLYAALNYDGVMEWSVAHPLDEQVAKDFNQHQHFDKGFGPALGPDATAHLKQGFERLGYAVSVATSPWVMGPDDGDLQAAFLEGLEQPLSEIGTLTDGQIRDWLDFRLAKIEEAGSSCVVGHSDILALPRH
ncbi:Methyltransferase domain-containing protein [Rhizobium sp. RU33A]|uniref:class I SAM-dependent methyltransferase n=1 Tax=Rhizobium sp. RU33A TaxID=1907413 RepID=UPI0009542100|nr:class I SAM-dependent methyltransferase [Rhizobium sp. RU33A]SIP98075.1 Methyltransferase domain-containing protein [Rhizobium sp. RU33A]